jgi:hypothetical protein
MRIFRYEWLMAIGTQRGVKPFFSLIAAFFVLFSSQNIQAQSERSKWTPAKTVSDVDVLYQLSTCDGVDVIFVRFVNRNPYPVRITWKEVFDTQMEKNIVGKGLEKSLLLPVGETVNTDCNQDQVPACKISAKQIAPHYRASLQGYRLTELSVTKQ